MSNVRKLSVLMLLVTAQALSPLAMAADTSVASLNISGNVPTIFNVTARGYPGDLDLNGNGIVASDRLIGTFHFKYNVDLASLTLKSAEASGLPTNAAGAGYTYGATGFKLKFGTCTSIAAAYKTDWAPLAGTPAVDLGAGIDIKSLVAGATTALTAGREEECDLTATWSGGATNFPLAGKYSLTITLTMVSI